MTNPMTDFEKALEAWQSSVANKTIGGTREIFRAGWDAALKEQAELVDVMRSLYDDVKLEHGLDEFEIVEGDGSSLGQAKQALAKLETKGTR